MIEVEIKYSVLRLPDIRDRLVHLGACSRGEVFEQNIRFEDPDHSLIQNRSLLRLRKDRQNKLTFKYPSAEQNDQFKILNELEVEVDNFETMQKILTRIGFIPAQIYEKRRETFELEDLLLCIDTMPYGVFLEIEGKKDHIRTAAEKLGLDWSKRILINYLEIFTILKDRLGFTFDDLTFENFKSLAFDMTDYLDVIEVGTE